VSSAAHRIGNAAFLAPDTVISPFRRRPPMILSLSMLAVLVRCQGLHGKRVNFFFHPVAQRRVNHLMPGNQAFAFERGADNQSLEMRAITAYFDMLTRQVRFDIFLNLLRSR